MIRKYADFIKESNDDDVWLKYGYDKKTRSVKLDMSLKAALEKYAPWYDVQNAKTKLYRNVENDSDVKLIDPKKSKRYPRHTPLFYQLFMDEWPEFPKRSESILCSTEPIGINLYGPTTYRVIPLKENSKIAVAPSADIWSAFDLSRFIIDNEINIDSWSYSIDSVSIFIERCLFGDEKYNLKMDLDEFKQISKQFKEKGYPDYLDNFGDRKSIFKSEAARKNFIEKYENGFYDMFVDMIKPDNTDNDKPFEIIEYNNDTFISHSKREVWTDETCIMIKNHLI